MTRVETVLLPLLIWRQIILLYALLLGLEGPALLLAAVRYRRPRVERLAAVVPVAAFCALLVVARALFDTYTYWHTYAAWEVVNYPSRYWATMLNQTAQDAAPSVSGVQSLGIVLAVLTAALLAGGWALVIRWQAQPPPSARRHAPVETAPASQSDASLEIAVGPITGPLADEPTGAEGEQVGG
ncbi:MAG TPA: hypothetical protein VIG30_12480 [Ktedonobacterales bacterium]|jgi:hypothetical protein